MLTVIMLINILFYLWVKVNAYFSTISTRYSIELANTLGFLSFRKLS